MNASGSSADRASWTSLLKVFPVALIIGNVPGTLEIFYIYFRLRTLAVSSPLELVSYAAGGGVVYGALFGFIVGVPIGLVGVLAWPEVRRDPEVRLTALVLVLLAAGFLFPVVTQWYFLDVPGLFELDRFADVILGLSLFAGLMYVALRYLTVQHFLLRSLSGGLESAGASGNRSLPPVPDRVHVGPW